MGKTMKELSPPAPELLPDERLDEVNERLRLIQKKQGLTFGTDAYLLAAFIRPQPDVSAVELGAGTGIVSLLLTAKEKIRSVTAVEIQPSFADLIRRNAMLNGMQERVTVLQTDVRSLAASKPEKTVRLVFSNPPYLKAGTGRLNEAPEKEIARHELFGGIDDFCAAASRLLGSRGRFVCVWRPERLADLFSALRNNRLEPKRMVTVYPDEASAPCVVLVESVKDASASLRVLPPLLLYRTDPAQSGTRQMTDAALRVYETCAFPDSGSIRQNIERKI